MGNIKQVFIDNGHGDNTPGKRSPDGRLLEWIFNRHLAAIVYLGVEALGLKVRFVCEENGDVSLTERCKRVNRWLKEGDGICISIHVNAAASDKKWHDARGWGAYVALNASAESKKLATLIAKEMEAVGVKVRKQGVNYYHTQNLAICRDTKCPAVLTENLFMDNLEDVKLLLDEDFVKKLAKAHVNAIKKYIDQ